MLSACDMARLMVSADKAKARLVLVGDVKQLGSVGAGAAFAQLQATGMATAKLAEIVRQTNAETRDAVLASIEGHAGRALAALERGGGRVIEAPGAEERLAAMARLYLALSPKERDATLVIEPSREGRDRLTQMIRDKLTASGELSAKAITFTALETKGLTKAEAREAASYSIGDVVRFNRDYPLKGIRRGEALAIRSIDPERGRIALVGRQGDPVEWCPRQWGAGRVEVFEPREMELRIGDRVQFTRNDRERGRANGLSAVVTVIDLGKGRATAKLANGHAQQLDLVEPRDTHLRHAYVQTTHAAQGRTAERVLVHVDSRSTNLVDQKMLYVALSRAKAEAIVVTDDRERLMRAIYERAGEKQIAMESTTRDLEASKQAGAEL